MSLEIPRPPSLVGFDKAEPKDFVPPSAVMPPLKPAAGVAVGQVSNVANYETHAANVIEDATKNIKVSGYRLLIILPKMKERSAGGIIIDDQLLDKEKLAACIGYVAQAGPDAYADPKKFPKGPFCKEGDWVIFKSYSGTRLKSTLNGLELRLINDDSVEAVIDDVTKYTRV